MSDALIVGLVSAGVTGTIGLATVASSWWVSRHNVRIAKVSATAEVQEAINNSFGELTEAHRDERKALSEQIDGLTGYIRDLIQHIESLEVLLRKKGIPIPKRRNFPHPLAVIKGGKLEA